MRKHRTTSLVESVGKDKMLQLIAQNMSGYVNYTRTAYGMVMETAREMSHMYDTLPRRPNFRASVVANPVFRGMADGSSSSGTWRMRIRPPVLSSRGPALTLG